MSNADHDTVLPTHLAGLMCCLLAGLLAGCTTAGPATDPAKTSIAGTIRVVGSDTMLVLNRRLAEEFMRCHPGTSILLRGGGTGRGVEALLDGEADLCAASRPLTALEVQALYEQNAALGLRSVIAQDALSVYLHPDNPVRSLSLEQLRGLFNGSIRSWAEVGGAAQPVEIVLRPPSSGTYRFFRDHVLKGDEYRGDALTVARTVDVLRSVSTRTGAVGFGGLAYGDEVVHCAIDGVAPTPENAREGRYPLVRYLQLVTTGKPHGLAKRFIDWCQGPHGQRVVAEVGYLPLWSPQAARPQGGDG